MSWARSASKTVSLSHIITIETDTGQDMISFLQLMHSEINQVVFCIPLADRWRWSLLVVCALLLVCLAVLIFYLQHGFVKSKLWFCLSFYFCTLSAKYSLLKTRSEVCNYLCTLFTLNSQTFIEWVWSWHHGGLVKSEFVFF